MVKVFQTELLAFSVRIRDLALGPEYQAILLLELEYSVHLGKPREWPAKPTPPRPLLCLAGAEILRGKG
jgi:hypothetical protein